MADTEAASSALHNLLSDLIPYPVFRILASFSNLLYRLFLNTSNDPSSLTSTLLPPLITLGLAYVALLMAYRTVRSMLSLAWFGIKWGAIIGGLIAVWAWYTDNADAVNSMGRAQNGGFMGQSK